MIAVIALVLFAAVLVAMMIAPGTARQPRPAVVTEPQPVESGLAHTA